MSLIVLLKYKWLRQKQGRRLLTPKRTNFNKKGSQRKQSISRISRNSRTKINQKKQLLLCVNKAINLKLKMSGLLEHDCPGNKKNLTRNKRSSQMMKQMSRISRNSMTKTNQKEHLLLDVSQSINPNLKKVVLLEHHCLRMKKILMRNKGSSQMTKSISRISRNSMTKINQKEQLLLGVAINPNLKMGVEHHCPGMKKILMRRGSRQITSSPQKTTLNSFKDR